MRVYRQLTDGELEEIWSRFAAGENMFAIATSMGRTFSHFLKIQRDHGGVRPRLRQRSQRHLSIEEREEISRGLADGRSLRAIASGICRATSTVSREVERNGGPSAYRAHQAERRARHQARRPKSAKLTTCPRLRRLVEQKLEKRWSPRQIAGWLIDEYPLDDELRVSHETIYQSLYVQGRGALRHELHRALRTGRALRKPVGHTKNKARSRIPEMVMISERPAEVEDRAVPGHWEGDLIIGTRRTCIGTLVERSTRFVLLMKLENGTAEEMRRALTKKIRTLPKELRRSVTWDQGNEMAQHREFTVATGVQVYFCDPHSPWQRGTNENTNGLLRQYFPKSTDLSVHTASHLNAVARELNERPRATLGRQTPLDKLAEALR
jgi:IS30 family transposase